MTTKERVIINLQDYLKFAIWTQGKVKDIGFFSISIGRAEDLLEELQKNPHTLLQTPEEILDAVGPEGCYVLAKKLIETANKDVYEALEEHNK